MSLKNGQFFKWLRMDKMTIRDKVQGLFAQSGIPAAVGSDGGAQERKAAGRPVLCDGAMGTMFYGGGVFINRCYDELNVSQPELVRSIHAQYLQAGAEIIETNTFGANSFRLERYGLA